MLTILATSALIAAGSGGPSADSTLTIVRLQYDGGGDWYANPSSLPNLLAAIQARTGLPVASREVTMTAMDASLRDQPYLYMTGHGNVGFTSEEREALRAYLLAGGFLHADDNYGMDESFRREIAAIFPELKLTEIPADHPVFHSVYEFPAGLPKIHEHDGERPQALGIFNAGRLLVFYSYESDLGDGWEDEGVHDDTEDVREAAIRMGVNLFVYALTRMAL